MVINDHPTVSNSGPGEKQTWSSLSERKCQGQEICLRAGEGSQNGFCCGSENRDRMP